MFFVMLTGANDSYMNTLVDFIRNYKSIGCPLESLIVYDLGLSIDNLKVLLSESPTLIIRAFPYEKYPAHVNLHSHKGLNCSYAFKPIIIHTEAQLTDIPVIWMDSANRFMPWHLEDILHSVNKVGFYCPISNVAGSLESIELNHPDTVKILGVTREEHHQRLPSVSANIVGVKYSSEVGKYILDEWYQHSLQEGTITPAGSSRNNHRQDQTVLSLVMFKYARDHEVTFEPSNFGIGMWIKLDAPIMESGYRKFALYRLGTPIVLAIIWERDYESALRVYSMRKDMDTKTFLQTFRIEEYAD